eukprot:UN27735
MCYSVSSGSIRVSFYGRESNVDDVVKEIINEGKLHVEPYEILEIQVVQASQDPVNLITSDDSDEFFSKENMLFFGAGGCILLLCCCLGFLTRKTRQQVLGPTMSWKEQITMSKFPSPTFNFVSQLNPRDSGIPIQTRSSLQPLSETIHKKRSPVESSFLQMTEGKYEDYTIATPD